MSQDMTVAIDLAKTTFQLLAVDSDGTIHAERRVNRKNLEAVVAQWPRALVAMEAGPGAHHWARRFQAAGHPVRLLAAQAVRAYATPGRKNDRRDAIAIAEAASRRHLRDIQVKTQAQQEAQSQERLLRAYQKQRTQSINALRSLLQEFGFVFPRKPGPFKRHYRALADNPAWLALHDDTRARFDRFFAHILHLDDEIKDVKRALEKAARTDDEARRLTTIPGVGPTISVSIRAAVGDGRQFANARRFAAWLGLTPALHASGARTHLGRITRRGNPELRALLVNGAQSLLQAVQRDGAGADRLRQWAERLLQRKPWTVVVTAVANKLARIIWRVLTFGEAYRPQHA